MLKGAKLKIAQAHKRVCRVEILNFNLMIITKITFFFFLHRRTFVYWWCFSSLYFCTRYLINSYIQRFQMNFTRFALVYLDALHNPFGTNFLPMMREILNSICRTTRPPPPSPPPKKKNNKKKKKKKKKQQQRNIMPLQYANIEVPEHLCASTPSEQGTAMVARIRMLIFAALVRKYDTDPLLMIHHI